MLQFPEDRYTVVDGYQIRYWSEGDPKAPVLLLIHGLGASVEYWFKNIFELAKHYRVIALDLPGFGKSDKPDVQYNLDFYATFLEHFCNHLTIDKLFLAAHSLGGAIALRYTLDHLEQVERLVLADNVGFAAQVVFVFRLMGRPFFNYLLTSLPKSVFAKALRGNVFDAAVITDEMIDILYPMVSSPGTRRAMRQITKHNTNWCQILESTLKPLWLRFSELSQLPVLLFWGKQDYLLSADVHVSAAKSYLPQLKLKLLDRCGHIPQLEHPTVFNEAVLAFLKGTESE